MPPLARCRMDGQLCSPAYRLQPSSTNEGEVPGCIQNIKNRCFQPAVNRGSKTSSQYWHFSRSQHRQVSTAARTTWGSPRNFELKASFQGFQRPTIPCSARHRSATQSKARPPKTAAAKPPLSRSNPGALKIRQPASFRFLYFSRALLPSHPFLTRPLYSVPLNSTRPPPPSSRRTLRTSLSFRRAQLAKNLHSSRQAKRTSAQSTSFDNVSYNLPRQTRILGQDGSC